MKPKLSIFALTLVAVACSTRGERNVDVLTWSRDTVFADLELLKDASDTSDHGDVLLRPMSVRTSEQLRFVADLGANQIAVLDSAARIIRRIGTRGSGPGELYGVSHLAVHNRHVFVGEALNGRVSEFTDDGNFVQTYSSPFAAGGIAVGTDDVMSVARSRTHYAARLSRDADPKPALTRQVVTDGRQSKRWTAMPGHDLIAADSSSTWVLDQGSARICRFPTGKVARCIAFPADLHRRLSEYRDDRVTRLEAATQLQVNAAPLVKDMVLVGTQLALLLPLPELPIVLVNTTDGTLTPILYHGSALPSWARAARSCAWDGLGFFCVGDEGVGRFNFPRSYSHR